MTIRRALPAVLLAVLALPWTRARADEPAGKDAAPSAPAATADAAAAAAGPASPAPEAPPSFPALRLTGLLEAGFLAVVSHTAQFGGDGTVFNYRREGGQETLFQVYRASAELRVERAHRVVFLYQPLSLRTEVSLRRTVRVDGLDFPAGTTVDLVYDFPFYRMSYLYDAAPAGIEELSFGLSLQIRNASISFRSADGALFRQNRDVGPVPLLKLRGRFALGGKLWAGYEVDWIYAAVSYLNGSDSDVKGALLDASVRAGATFDRVEAFLNVRWLSGGASGTGDPDGASDGFVSNWLDFLTVTLGIAISI